MNFSKKKDSSAQIKINPTKGMNVKQLINFDADLVEEKEIQPNKITE